MRRIGVNSHRPINPIIIDRNLIHGIQSSYSPDFTRLILVASGTISRDGKVRSLAKGDLTPETFKRSKNDKGSHRNPSFFDHFKRWSDKT
ncbi:MAG: hypothetical protein ABSA76_10170 [Bacteroidales bacterium]